MKVTFEFNSIERFDSLVNYGSLKQLSDWAHDGWDPGMKVIDELLIDLSLNIEFKQDITPAVQGWFFDIGLVCSDIPEHWFNPQPTNPGAFNGADPIEDNNPIQIGINLSGLLTYSCALERGAAIAVLVMYLVERLKRPVIIKHFYGMGTEEDSFEGSVIIKQLDDVVDEKSLSFWLCCPDVLHCWTRIMEDTSCLREMTSNAKVNPDMQYGKLESNIFISLDPETQSWTRNDSKRWITSVLNSFGASVPSVD
jgi:hypothetical protein